MAEHDDDFGKVLDKDVSSVEEELTVDTLAAAFSQEDVQGKARTNDMATQNALIQGKGADMRAINLAKADNSASASLAIAAEQGMVAIEQKLHEAGIGFAEIAPDQVEGTLEMIVKGQEAVNSMRTSPVSTEMAVIQRASSVPLEQAVRERLGANLALRNEISRMMDESGKLDFITDIAGQMIPLRMGMDWEDVKTAITEHKDLKGVLDGSSIVGMIGSWQAMTPERIEALTPALVEAVLAATGVDYSLGLGIPFLKSDKNVLAAAGILLRFMQPEGGERALETVQALSALDVVTLGMGSFGKAAITSTLSARTGRQLAKLGDLPLDTRRLMENILGNATEYARKKHAPIKLIAQAGDIKQAARLNLKVVTDDEIAKAYGMPSDVAYTNTMPARASSLNPEFIKGMVSDTAEMMNDFIRGSKGFVRSMTTESELLRLGVIHESEYALVVRSFFSDMTRKGVDLMAEGIHLTDVKVIGKPNAQGFKYQYTITNTKQQLINPDGSGTSIPSTHTAFRSWKVDEVTGNFTETMTDLASPSSSSIPGQSPAAWSVTKPGKHMDFNDTVKQSIALEDLAVASKTRINEQWLDANSSISGLKDTGARGRIESIELAGDEYINQGSQIRGKVYTENELISGVKTGNGIVYLTKQNEIEAYFKRKVFSDSMWDMQNYVTRRELQIAGFNNSIGLKGQQLAVKQFETAEAAARSVANRPNYAVYLANEDVVTPITSELIVKMYEKGRVLVRSRNDWNVTGAGDLAKGGEVVEYMFIEPNRLRALPEQVLHYKIGYVPKINEGVEFVVKQKFSVTKQGVQGHTVDHALRAFSSKQDAMTFKQQQVAILLSKMDNVTLEQQTSAAAMFEIADGSAMKQMERMESALSGSGGLYTGTRSVDDLLMGLDGVKLERLAPGEAFGRYIDHMGNALARNEWRIGQEKQWLNTVAKMDGKIKQEGFNGTRMPNTPEGKAMNRMRDQINTWNRVPSRQESMFEGAAQKYHDFVLNGARGMGLDKNSIKHALWLKHTDPIAAALTANMHLMLGTMNPAQIYVQASAAVVALSLVKINKIPGVINTAIRMGVMDNIKDGSAAGKVYKELVKGKEANAEELVLYSLWKRSGLLESVRSNADMNYMSATGVGITFDLMRNASNASLLFYRAGELMNRRISFAAAFSRWREANLKGEPDDAALLSIIQEANKTMMELNSANKAWWQGGAGKSAIQRVFSMTGQFQQVLAKTVELTLKGEKRGGFNIRQKARIGAGQLLMFGAAGVPLISIGVGAYFQWIGHEPTAEEANAVNQGMMGVITKQAFGADVDVANRAALLSGTFETIKDTIMSKDPMWQKFFAVTGTSGVRIIESIGEATDVTKSQAFGRLAELEPFLSHNRSSETEMSEPTMLETFADIATVLAKTTTTGRNALKARMMHNSGKILDRRGRVTVDEKDGEFSFADKVGVALGFQLTRESSARLAQQGSRELDEEITEAADAVVAAYHRFVYTHDMNPKYAQSVTNMVQLMHESLDNEWKINKMMEQVNRKLFTDSDSLEAREMKKFFERTAPEHISEGVMLDTSSQLSLGNVFNKQAIVQPFQRVLEEENK